MVLYIYLLFSSVKRLLNIICSCAMDPDAKALVDDPWVCPNDRELGLRAK